MHWIVGRKSNLSLHNKRLIYITIFKPVWTYGIPLWGTAFRSHIALLQRFQNKFLHMATSAPWYVPNRILHADLCIPTVYDEITRLSSRHLDRIKAHPN
jgi:hypothetical protein